LRPKCIGDDIGRGGGGRLVTFGDMGGGGLKIAPKLVT